MISSRPSDIFQPGDLLNSTYRIETILGRGGTSEVYRARSEISDRVVALKVLSSEFSNNDDYLVLMKREEEIRDIRHDAVVRYSENNRTPDGHVYLSMDYVEGPSLEQKLKSGGMSADDLLAVAGRVCEGLVATHASNIIHRDLSPDNILLRNGEPTEAVIIDFGIAKDTNPGAATIVGNEFAGKYAYAAPEQLSGNSDARSDLYSLGAVLLATFRGKKPNIGKNPMEVIEIKSKALDTIGVPETLRTLIDKMTKPDPSERFQSAGAVLDKLDPQLQKTIIAPPGPNGKLGASTPAKPPKDKSPPIKKGRGGGIGLILGVAAVAAVGGLYFVGALDRILTPSIPTVDPYILVAQGGQNTPPNVSGNVPNTEFLTLLSEFAISNGGQSDLALATGNIGKNWGPGVQYLFEQVNVLEEWSVAVNGNDYKIAGLTNNKQLRDFVDSALNSEEPLAGLAGSHQILLGPRILPTAAVEEILESVADCGPLEQKSPPNGGYEIGSSIVITGQLSSSQARGQLFDALEDVAGDRKILIGANVLDADSCLMDGFLGRFAPGGFEVVFRDGNDNEVVETGEFRPGSNPIIDIVVPENVVDGYLWLSIVDISGDVFHLLPNTNRFENAVSELRTENESPFVVRASFGFREASGDTSKIAFNIDDRLGASKILVFHSTAPMFTQLRPVSESLASFTEALSSDALNSRARVLSLDYRDLVTVP